MKEEISPLPRHIAIIMDGNRRWARLRGLPPFLGHVAGLQAARRIIDCLLDYGIKYLTLYAFSTENWSRSEEEIENIFKLLEEVVENDTPIYHEKGIRLLHLGRTDRIPPALLEKVKRAIELTSRNDRMTVAICFNYGGRAEIVDAARRLLQDGIKPETLNEEVFSRYLYAPDLPDPDLIIRTGGERRLSNFLLWQSAYAELYFTQTLWPDFDEEEMRRALIDYSRRERRFGGP